MPVPASDVAAALRERRPGLPTLKLHKLLYYCQGHHLATFGHPLFAETISAWDMGPVVGGLWRSEKEAGQAPSRGSLGEAELNTVGYVLSRYGSLTGLDLMHLTHSEDPWRLANAGRPARTSARIELRWIEDYFRSAARDDGDEDVVLDAEAVKQWLRDAVPGPAGREPTDDADEIALRITELRVKLGKE